MYDMYGMLTAGRPVCMCNSGYKSDPNVGACDRPSVNGCDRVCVGCLKLTVLLNSAVAGNGQGVDSTVVIGMIVALVVFCGFVAFLAVCVHTACCPLSRHTRAHVQVFATTRAAHGDRRRRDDEAERAARCRRRRHREDGRRRAGVQVLGTRLSQSVLHAGGVLVLVARCVMPDAHCACVCVCVCVCVCRIWIDILQCDTHRAVAVVTLAVRRCCCVFVRPLCHRFL
jgi:hypothetical protein